LLAAILLSSCGGGKGDPGTLVKVDVDWPSFLARQDPVWERLSTEWKDGAFTGNGLLGTMTYRKDDKTLLHRLGRSDVTAHYRIQGVDWSIPRVPIGDLLLRTSGTVLSETMRLHLWDAEVRGETITDMGRVAWRVFTHAEDEIIVLETVATGGEKSTLALEPAHGISPRIVSEGAEVPPDKIPPLPVCTSDGVTQTCVQTLLPGGDYATAWRSTDDGNGRQIAYISVANGWPDGGAAAKAGAAVNGAVNKGLDSLETSHRSWWHAWWPRDLISIPDGRWQSFYWIQLYKHASATRSGRPLIDNQGPWLTATPWPGTWWNLNVQLSYSPVYATDRLDQGLSLIEGLAANRRSLRLNTGGVSDSAHIDRYTSLDLTSWNLLGEIMVMELGNLTWALHDVWRHYRAGMDDTLLKNLLFPLLRESVNLYLAMIEEGDDGKLHLPPTHSPEYDQNPLPGMYRDCNYALALLRWGCTTLLWSSDRLGVDDPLKPRWSDVLDRLTPYPVNENGLMVGADKPFAHGHRHFSHLLSIFPLYEYTGKTPEELKLIDTSVNHWMDMGESGGDFEGYSWVASSAMASLLGRGDKALEYLDRVAPRFEPSTMYVEAGPVIETPLFAARAIQDMLLQSHGGIIRVFPAVPAKWRDAVFHRLRAEGAFRVSASREAGKTNWIFIESLAGEPCRLKTDIPDPVISTGSFQGTVEKDAAGNLILNLKAGESVLLYSGTKPPEAVVRPVAVTGEINHYGLKAAR
jgi:hypothetical protein